MQSKMSSISIIKIIILFFVTGLLTFCLYSYVFKESINKKEFIKNILNYTISTDIIKRCQKDHNYTHEDMIILEQELKKYFVLASLKSKQKLKLGMYSKDIDNLWHTFILFTKDYADFCRKYTHHFIHHIPEIDNSKTPEDLVQVRQDFQTFIINYENTFHQEIHPIWLLDICENDISNV